MNAPTIDSTEKINAILTPDQKLASVPTWTVQSGDATLAVATDGLSAFLISGAAGIQSSILVEAEGDPTPGVDHLSLQIVLTVVAPEAKTLGLSFGTAVPK